MKKEDALKKLQDSEDTEFEVYTESEHKTFLENYEKSVVDPKIKAVHDQYDEDLLKITGKKRSQDQKTYDFMKQVFASREGNQERIKELETEIGNLKEQLKKNTGDENLKTELEAAQKELKKVQETYKKEKETWETEKSTMLSDHERVKLSNILDRALMGIKFKEGISDQVRDIVIENVKNKLLETAEIVEGKMIFKDKDGNTLRNKADALNPFTPEEMLKVELKDIIDPGKKIEGPEKKPEIKTDDKGEKSVNFVPSDWVKTKEDLHKDLSQKGFVHGTEEYNIAWKQFSADMKYK